jgi:hypothetical protein
LRREEIAALADGDGIEPWPAAPSARRGAANNIGPPVKTTDPETGVACALLTKLAFQAAQEFQVDPMPADQAGDFTAYVVVKPFSLNTPNGFRLGVAAGSTGKVPWVDTSGARVQRAGQTDVWTTPLLVDHWQLWSVRLAGSRLELHFNGVEVAGRDDAAAGSTPMRLIACEAGTLAVAYSCLLGELLLLPYAASDAENAAWLTYFRGRFPLVIPTP